MDRVGRRRVEFVGAGLDTAAHDELLGRRLHGVAPSLFSEPERPTRRMQCLCTVLRGRACHPKGCRARARRGHSFASASSS
jgi:hypothetical protein